MKTDSHSGAHDFKENPERFMEFIRKVSPEADPVSIFIFGKLTRASRQLKQAMENHLASDNLSWAKFRLLLDLMRHENINGEGQGMQPSELSDQQGLSRNTISALIASMEQDGFISRELHHTDHRKFVIRMTERGRDILSTELDSEFKFLTQCFTIFSAEEREQLDSFLSRLNANVLEK